MYARRGSYIGFTGLLPMATFIGGFYTELSFGGAFVAGHRLRPRIGIETVAEVSIGILPQNTVSWHITAGPKFYFRTDAIQPYVFVGAGPGQAIAGGGARGAACTPSSASLLEGASRVWSASRGSRSRASTSGAQSPSYPSSRSPAPDG